MDPVPDVAAPDVQNSDNTDPETLLKHGNYKIWKKNAPRLYDFFLSTALLWPSMTVQWFPDKEMKSQSHSIQRLLLGTRTSYQMDECVRIVHATLPAQPEFPNGINQWNESLQELGGYTSAKDYGTKVVQKIFHKGEVNKARYMPQNPDILASLSSDTNVYIYDRTRHPLTPPVVGKPLDPDVTLSLHKSEGFGLSWNPNAEGKLLSAAGTEIGLWDLTKFDKTSKSLNASQQFNSSSHSVNDIEWHPFQDSVFGSAVDDGRVLLHDIRQGDKNGIVSNFGASEFDTSSLAFNRQNSNLLATSDASGQIFIWDLRTCAPLFTMHKHSGSVVSLEWSPHDPTILASGSTDTRVMLWDVAAELPEHRHIFTHAGHMADVSDISWNPAVPWMLASVADNNEFHIWTPAKNLVCPTTTTAA